MRIKKSFHLLWPMLFLFTGWFVFASPYFIKQLIPYPSNFQVSFFTPWNAYPQYAGPVKNNAISDVVNQIYPWKHFTIEELKKGNLPLWNPYSFSGTPHLANYQSAVFSPFNLLFFLLPFIDAWSLLVLLQPLLAGIFLYLYLRELKRSQVGSLIGSIGFMFCGFITVWMPYGTLAMAVVFLPLALFAVEKYYHSLQIRYGLLLTLSIPLSFFAGHFQMSLYLACFVFVYLLFSFFHRKDIKVFWHLLTAYVLGLFVSLLQIIPSLELYQLAVRSELFINKEGIPWYYLVTLFAPDFFGNPVTRNDWIGHYAEWASFIGIIPFFLAITGLFVKKHKAVIYFFFFAGIVALLLSLDTQLQQLLALLKIPVFSTSIPSRIIVLFSFSFTVLAAFGFDYLYEQVKQKSFKKLFLIMLPTITILGSIWIVVIFSPVLPADKAMLAKRNLLLPTVLFACAIGGIVFARFVKRQYVFVALSLLFILLTTFDSWRFVQKWIPFDERTFVFPSVPVIEKMQQNIGYGRVYGDFGAYIDTYYHLASIEGYDPLYSKRYGEVLQSAKTGKFTSAVRSLATLDERGKYAQRVLDILGVTLIYQPISHSNQPFAFPIWEHPEKFPTVYRDDKFAVFTNTTAMPRVQIFSQYEVIQDEKKLVERLFSADFDYRNILLLEEDPGLLQGTRDSSQGKAEVVLYTPNKVIIAVHSDQEGLLFLSDTYYPLWKATVNGNEEKIYAADHTLRAVKIPKGTSRVEFIYQGLF